MSFEKVDLHLQPSTLYFLTGENLDIGGRNGIGKSALIEGIVFSIYGKNIRVGSKDIKELITTNKRELKTEINLDKWVIKRERTKTKASVRLFECNGEKLIDVTKRTNTETDNFINYTLLPFDKFMYVNYFNPQSLIFFSLTPKQRFEVIESLLNLEVVNELLEQYKEQQRQISEQLHQLSTKKVKCQVSIDMLEKQIADIQLHISDIQQKLSNQREEDKELENRLYEEFMKVVDQIKQQHEHYTTTINETKKAINELEIKLQQFNIQSSLSISDINSELLSISQQLTNYTQLKSTIESAKKKGVCPTCNQPYILNEDEYVRKQTNNKLSSYDQLLHTINTLTNKYTQLQKLQSKLTNYTQLKQKYELLKQTLENQEKQYQQYISDIKANYPYHYNFIFNYDNSALYTYIEQKKKEYKNQSSIKALKDTLQTLKQQLTEYTQQYNQHLTTLQHIELKLTQLETIQERVTILINELSHNGEFRQTLLSRYLKELEESLNVMIKQLNPHFKLSLLIQQKGKNKGISVVIFDNGIEKSYGQLSTGERRMIDMSLLLTFSSFSSGFLLIDEALDALSYENQLKVIWLLKKLNKQILLVTHNQQLIDDVLDNDYNKTKLLWIEKKNNISSVIVK